VAWSSSGAETLIAALADGAGSAERAEAGARLATSIFVDVAAEHFKERNGSALPACELVRTGIEAAHAAVSAMAAHEDREIDDFASTLLVAILHAGGGAIGQIGDGAVVFSRGTERPWEPALWPDHGEYVNTTRF
jgi:serine/threonine protein phosphatase PrpC